MSDTPETRAPDAAVTPTAAEAVHTTLPIDFEDAVPFVQVEHELAGFETVALTRIDEMIAGALEEEVDRTALLVTCHAEIARDVLAIDPTLAGLLPCTTAIYETGGEVNVHHVSATKAMRDLGCAPAGAELEAVIERTGELMETVSENLEANAEEASGV